MGFGFQKCGHRCELLFCALSDFIVLGEKNIEKDAKNDSRCDFEP
ncbi:hypothetical protein [Senimuribacter intestinalis]|nr:hypothetical protein [Senimuribacter intestinalis]